MDTATEVTAAYLCNPDGLTAPEAVALAKQSKEPALARQVLSIIEPGPDGIFVSDRATMRALEILAALPPSKPTLATLLSMVRRCDSRVLSKVVLLTGRLSPSGSWYNDVCRDCDPRIRANAIEGLWGADGAAVISVFGAASRDPHHRVAMNSLIGLHMAGDPAGLRGVETMAGSADPARRAAAAWGLGHLTSDPDHPLLQQLRSDAEPAVKSAALRALVRIRKRLNGAG